MGESFLKVLNAIASEADQCVIRERRAAKPAGKWTSIPEDVKPQVEKLEKEYEKLLDKADRESSEQAMRSAEATKKAIDDIKAKYTSDTAGEEVCEICGIKYPMGNDGDHRGEAHFSGTMHIGYVKIRQALADVKKRSYSGRKIRVLRPSARPRRRRRRRNQGRKRKGTPMNGYAAAAVSLTVVEMRGVEMSGLEMPVRREKNVAELSLNGEIHVREKIAVEAMSGQIRAGMAGEEIAVIAEAAEEEIAVIVAIGAVMIGAIV